MLEDFYSDSEEEEYQSLLEESNMNVRRFLKKMKDDINGEELVLTILCFNEQLFKDETRNTQQLCVLVCIISCSLDSSISRVITFNIPLVPANTDLRTLLLEIKENQFSLVFFVIP